MNNRNFALILGIAFTLVAILGFLHVGTFPMHTHPSVTVQTGEGKLLGMFPVNVLHNLVHLLFGVFGILAFLGGIRPSIVFNRVVCVAYLLLAILGMLPNGMFQTTFGLIPIQGNDIWLHALIGLAAGFFGFVLAAPTAPTTGEPTPPPAAI